MRFYPTKIQLASFCFLVFSLILNLGCAKDSDLLLDSILEEEVSSVDEEEKENTPQAMEVDEEDVASEEEPAPPEPQEDNLESRTTSFSPTNDAHYQSGKGYNQSIIRLDEGNRTSYLMFDLSPIANLDGEITDVALQFTIESDNGSGNIDVFKATSSSWSEKNLSEDNVPEVEVQLGSIIKEYKIGETETVVLDASKLSTEISTLILNHKNGNDLAIASKEHASKIGPKLVVTYSVIPGTEEIVIPERNTAEDASGDENTTTEQETTQEEAAEEETTPEEPTDEEETTEEEPTQEGATEEETADEEPNQEETAEEETAEEEPNQEETAEEEVTEEEEPAVVNPPINQEPIAIADATPSSGGVPLEVSFTGGNSSDDIAVTSFAWDFKDGSSSTSANPSHTYTKTGTYEALLTVTDAEGLTTSDTVTITVNETPNNAPKAVVSATPVSGEAPLEVTFKGSSSTDDHSVSSYAWNLKDGSQETTADFKHTYEEPGTYVAELTVKDENGLTDKKTITITVTEPVNVAPVAKTSANTTLGEAPLLVQFKGDTSSDDKAITAYSWNFKDGSNVSNTENPSHTFTNAGTYTVELTVSDAEGLNHKNTITIRVTEPVAENEAPVVRLSANKTSGEAPLTVQFTGNQSSDDKAITSYLWNFKDGATSSSANPSHTFTQAGNFSVDLTVRDAEGASDTKSININVTNSVVSNAPPGFYVATNGNRSNSGKSPSSPWSLEHAFATARAGDVVYVKAGNYGKKEIITRNSGNSGALIKFIGYINSPGDIKSNGNSTFKYGETVNSDKMPLLSSSNGVGKAITIHHRYIHLENFQINNFGTGVQSINTATNSTLKNIIVTNSGNQNSGSAYDGFGITIRGNNSVIENCFVLNATAQGITMSNSDYSRVKNSSVYADNRTNPMDYYVFLAGGTNNTIVENCHVQRASGLSHNGHGFNVKDDASYNTFKNCTAVRTSFELAYSGVHHNIIDGGKIVGVGTGAGEWDARLAVVGGAHHNTIKNLLIQNTWTAISLATFNDRTGADASLGNDNTFQNITVKNTNRILNIGGGTNYNAKAKRYKFNDCSFSDFENVAVTYYRSEGFEFRNSTFKNGNKFVKEFGGVYQPYSKFSASWINCIWSNVNFTPPN